MREFPFRLWREEAGQDLTEYALLLVLTKGLLSKIIAMTFWRLSSFAPACPRRETFWNAGVTKWRIDLPLTANSYIRSSPAVHA